MTDGGCAASSRPLDRRFTAASLELARVDGAIAQRRIDADYIDAFAAKIAARFDPDTAGTIKPIIAGLATTIRAGIPDPDGVSHD